MRTITLFAIVILMSTVVTETITAQTLPTPQAVTDPKLIASKPNAQVEPRGLTIEKLYMTRQVGRPTWSPDGKSVAFVSNMSGRNNLWLVPAEGGWPVQLTVSDQRQTAPAWSPDGKWIAYQSDYDGDEQWDIFLVSPKTGKVVNLTSTREIAESDPTWSPDGRYLAYLVKPKISAAHEIDIYDTVMREVKHLTTNTPQDKGNSNPIWSKDGKFIVYTQEQAKGTDSNIFIADVATTKSTLLTPHEGEQRFFANDINPFPLARDIEYILITSNAENGYDNVGLLGFGVKGEPNGILTAAGVKWLTHDKWEIRGGEFSPDGKHITFTANVDGNEDIYLHDLATNKSTMLPIAKGVNNPAGGHSAFTKDGSRLLYYHNGPTAPGDLWVYTLATGTSHQVTHSLVAGVRSEDMVEPYLVHYPSRDGKWTISAFLYVPFNMARNGQNAAIVYIHGGPTSQTMNSFNRFVQYAANQGYMVLAPNYRGSTGYGKEFQQANLFDMGGGDLQDVLAGVDWIKQTGHLDPKKIAVMGGSYGGYLSMMSVTKAPEVWAAGVPIVPFVNWFTEIENEDPVLQQSDLATMGDVVKNKALYEDRSPINFIDQIKAPLLLLAGGHDPRCPKSETQQVVDAIKKRGGTVDYKIYENEGHGFARVENQIDAYKRVADFLMAHVPPADCSCSLTE
ncbi:MAG TPA: S9 family peptidase [Candidatus Dormibacteraeota bacterium]|jgi:dipeptidyl aminopeptidase/acylaminoacyl peptidase|nr:S9 family peptidase [Candidatus Dormibacteraeota bacterium]